MPISKKLFLGPLFAMIFCLFGTINDAVAETVPGVTYPFSLTTTNLNAGGNFKFGLSAKGTFYVDCGDGGTLSGNGVNGGTITKTDTTYYEYTCTYSTGGAKTLQFGGVATGYNNAAYASVKFNDTSSGVTGGISPNAEKIASISGDLSTIFPTIGTQFPRFMFTFYDAVNLTSIPENLFNGYTTGGNRMFFLTFAYCTGLTSIPANLFSGITTGAERMFQGTFDGCTNITGYIPQSTFAGLIANGSPTASIMWQDTFKNTQLVTSCPSGTSQVTTGYESAWGGKVACQPDQQPTTHTVTYMTGTCANGSSTVVQTDTATDGVVYNIPTTADDYMDTHIKTGYTFHGWARQSGQSQPDFAGGLTWTDGDLTVYAVCQPKKYNVIYARGDHPADGVDDYTHNMGATYDANYVALGANITGVAADNGWTFAGYTKDANPTFTNGILNNQFTGETLWHLDDDLTVYAAYKPVTQNDPLCTVTYVCNGVTMATVPYYVSPFVVEDGCDALPDGRAFTHWVDDNNETVESPYPCNGNTVFTAQYEEQTNPNPDPVNPMPVVGAIVNCAPGEYLAADDMCTSCSGLTGYFCPGGEYVSAGVRKGAYACLAGGVQNSTKTSCTVVLSAEQLLNGFSTGDSCWLKTDISEYVECMLDGADPLH